MVIKYLPLQPHCFAFGGFEIQMLSALRAVQNVGVNASPMDVWSRALDFDILHIWGLDPAQFNSVYWAKRSGVKVVVTGLLPYMETRYERMRHKAFSLFGNEKYMRKIAEVADAVVLVNEIQQEIAIRYFNALREKTYHIPNIVEEAYFQGTRGSFSEKYGIVDYILTAGNVCKRKNQLNLAKACIDTNSRLVIIGPVLAGEAEYGKELRSLVEKHALITWFEGFEPGSPDLVNAFKDCSIFALPSLVEQQPISALEAGACRVPLLLGAREYARQKYYQGCAKVDPNSVGSISGGIEAIKASPKKFVPPEGHIMECTSSRVGSKYKEVYERITG